MGLPKILLQRYNLNDCILIFMGVFIFITSLIDLHINMKSQSQLFERFGLGNQLILFSPI